MLVPISHLPPVRWLSTPEFSPPYADVQLLAKEQGVPVDELAALVEMKTTLFEHGGQTGIGVIAARQSLPLPKLLIVVDNNENGADVLSVGTEYTDDDTIRNAIARSITHGPTQREPLGVVRAKPQLVALDEIPYGPEHRERLARSGVRPASTDIVEAARLLLWAERAVQILDYRDTRRGQLTGEILANIRTDAEAHSSRHIVRNTELFGELHDLPYGNVSWAHGVPPSHIATVECRDALASLFTLRAIGVGINYARPNASLDELTRSGIEATADNFGETSPEAQALIALRDHVVPEDTTFFRDVALEI